MQQLIPFLPLIDKRIQEQKAWMRRTGGKVVRIGVPVVVAGGVVVWLWFRGRRRQVEAEVAKMHTDVNVRNAMLYAGAVKPPGLIMRLISKSIIGDALKAVDTVKGWFGMSETDQVLAITDRVVDWAATVKSYRILTGRTLNRDIQQKLGSDYPKFVDRLARNSTAVDIERRKRENEVATQVKSDAMRAIIMGWPPGRIKTAPKSHSYQNYKLTAKRNDIPLYAEPGHKKIAKGKAAGAYLGRPSDRFMNHDNKNAMVEITTEKGLVWAEWNDLTIWTATPPAAAGGKK
jgi:hypothetical protein